MCPVLEGAIAFLKRQAADIGLEYNVVEVSIMGIRLQNGYGYECMGGIKDIAFNIAYLWKWRFVHVWCVFVVLSMYRQWKATLL